MYATRKVGLDVTNWIPANSEAQREKTKKDWFCVADLAQTAEVEGSSETSELMKPPSLQIHSLWVIDFSVQNGARAKIKAFPIIKAFKKFSSPPVLPR